MNRYNRYPHFDQHWPTLAYWSPLGCPAYGWNNWGPLARYKCPPLWPPPRLQEPVKRHQHSAANVWWSLFHEDTWFFFDDKIMSIWIHHLETLKQNDEISCKHKWWKDKSVCNCVRDHRGSGTRWNRPPAFFVPLAVTEGLCNSLTLPLGASHSSESANDQTSATGWERKLQSIYKWDNPT